MVPSWSVCMDGTRVSHFVGAVLYVLLLVCVAGVLQRGRAARQEYHAVPVKPFCVSKARRQG